MNAWTVHIAMSEEVCKKDTELATGGSPATVAITSQIIPLIAENNVNDLRARKRRNTLTLPVSKGSVQDQMRDCRQCAGKTIQRA